MATLEGLQRALQSPESNEHRTAYTDMTTSNLTAYIYQQLKEPPPAGVDGSVAMIVELAIGIAANLSLESRDVAVTLPLPGEAMQPDFMELEKAGLPPLPDMDETEDSGPDGDKSKREKPKSGMLNMLAGVPPPGSRKSSVVSSTDMADVQAAPPKDASKVRFAGFVAVEVRGRQVLVKAPVWTIA
jgi:hypothetical protein